MEAVDPFIFRLAIFVLAVFVSLTRTTAEGAAP